LVDANGLVVCSRDILKGGHCKCSLATHMKLRLVTCHVEASDALRTSVESQKLNEEVYELDLSTTNIDFLRQHPPSPGKASKTGKVTAPTSAGPPHQRHRTSESKASSIPASSAYHWDVHPNKDVENSLDFNALPSLTQSQLRSRRYSSASASTAVDADLSSRPAMPAPALSMRPKSHNAASSSGSRPPSGLRSQRPKSVTSTTNTIGLSGRNVSDIAKSIRAEQVKKFREMGSSSHLGLRARKASLRTGGLMGRSSS
jgi:hypothetical protein